MEVEMETTTFDAKRWLTSAISKNNATKALKLARYLASKGYGCAIRESDDGVITITYADKNGEGQIWPAIRIDNEIIWPKGSPIDLMLDSLFK